jgi:predicted AAA+ superfamily ATPase
MMRILSPWHANISKRQVKSPKVYFRDSGLLHYVIGTESAPTLRMHPKVGLSWEGFALEEICRFYETDSQDCYFWSSHNEAELDLLILKNGKKIGFEFKYQDAPKLTPSMRIAWNDLELDELYVIYPGNRDYALTENIRVMNLMNFVSSNRK